MGKPYAFVIRRVFVVKPPFERPKLFWESPFCARCLMMGADDGAVDHLNLIWCGATLVQRLKNQFSETRQSPASELAIDRRPFAKLIRQVTPLCSSTSNPEDPVKNQAMIYRRATATDRVDERFKKCPFRIAHRQSRQDSLLKSYLESYLS